MRTRATPLDIPPARPPYFTVVCAGTTWYLRAPSLHRVARMIQAIGPEHQARLQAVASMVGQGRSLVSLVTSAPDVLELFGALVGITWADPIYDLEAPAWTTSAGDLARYGEAVFEELHEAGWSLQNIALAGLAIARQVQQGSQIDQEVTDKAAFFLQPKEPGSSRRSMSSATSSEPTSGDPSES